MTKPEGRRFQEDVFRRDRKRPVASNGLNCLTQGDFCCTHAQYCQGINVNQSWNLTKNLMNNLIQIRWLEMNRFNMDLL